MVRHLVVPYLAVLEELFRGISLEHRDAETYDDGAFEACFGAHERQTFPIAILARATEVRVPRDLRPEEVLDLLRERKGKGLPCNQYLLGLTDFPPEEICGGVLAELRVRDTACHTLIDPTNSKPRGWVADFKKGERIYFIQITTTDHQKESEV